MVPIQESGLHQETSVKCSAAEQLESAITKALPKIWEVLDLE